MKLESIQVFLKAKWLRKNLYIPTGFYFPK